MSELIRCPNCGRMNRVRAAASGTPRCATAISRCHGSPTPGDGTFAEIAEAASVPVIIDMWAPEPPGDLGGSELTGAIQTMEVGGANGSANRSLRPDSVRHMSVTTAAPRRLLTADDTR